MLHSQQSFQDIAESILEMALGNVGGSFEALEKVSMQ